MTSAQKNTPGQSQDLMQIQDLLHMCLAKWRWFVLSLAVCLGVACCYILTTHPVYTRSTSILIKDDSKGKSSSGDLGSFADFGMFSTSTNVNNEMGMLKSPDLMREVVSRLHLDIDYYVKGRFHKQSVYGKTLPVTVSFVDLSDRESVKFVLELSRDGALSLSDFESEDIVESGIIKGNINDTLQSPFGRIVVLPSTSYAADAVATIYVSKSSLRAATAHYSSVLVVSLADEKSNIITLSIKNVSTQRAEDVLNTLVSVYNENWVKDKNQIAISTSMFIDERLEVIKRDLGNVDNSISSYKSEHLVPDVQAAASMYMSQVNEATAQIKELNNQAYMARYIRNYLASEVDEFQLLPANSGIENPSIESQIDAYNKQVLERNNLVSYSSAKNPVVIEMDASLSAMRNALLTSIDNQLVALNAQIQSQQGYSGQATSQIASNPQQAKYLLSVERQQKVMEALYLFLLQKREDNELSQAFTAYNTRIITTPNGSMSPIAPLKRNILLVAFVIGLLVPVVIIFLKENMNTRVRGRKDLENLSVPFVGEIPLYSTDHSGSSWPFRKKQPEERAIVVKAGKRDVINEAFRVLRTNLEFMTGKDKKTNVITVTSFNPGSGKTFLTMNIAAGLGINGKKVLVIDGDMRHGSASSYINSPKIGLSDYLSGRTDDLKGIIVAENKNGNPDVLPVGTIPPNPTELLFEDRFASMIEDLRNKYDYILIDCPPIEIVADTQIIEKLVDRTLFVVRAGLLDRSMLYELENIYREKKFKNMGMILNGTAGTGGRYGYGNRYGYGYGYGYGYHNDTPKKKQGIITRLLSKR